MGWRIRISALLGYDARLVALMEPTHVRMLARVTAPSMFTCVLVGASAGLGMWMVSRMVAFSLVTGVGFGLLVLNLTRLIIAGGGLAPHQDGGAAAQWHPRLAPLITFTFLGMFFAQPAALLVVAAELDPMIDAYRAQLVEMHDAAVLEPLLARKPELETEISDVTRRLGAVRDRLAVARRQTAAIKALKPAGKREQSARDVELRMLEGAERDHVNEEARLVAQGAVAHERAAALDARVLELQVTDLADYARHLSTSSFLVRRVRLLWERPEWALPLTALFCALLLLPHLVARWLGLAALRSYESIRRSHTRRHAELMHVATCDSVETVLREWQTYAGPPKARFADPPFNTIAVREFPDVIKTVTARDILRGLPRR